MTIAKLSLVALDCPDPHALAAFYMSIVGGHIHPDTETGEWVRVSLDGGCDLGFQLDPNHQPTEWPDGPPQQLHLDFDVTDLDAAEHEVIALGAVKTAVQPEPSEWRVFLDPAGHPFCLIKR
jgi:predicted enzyme related to lactoylglutathione lyase